MPPGEIIRPMHDWAGLRIELFWAYQSRFPQGLRAAGPVAAPFRIWGVREGVAEAAYAATTLRGEAGDWLILPESPRWQRLAPGTRLLSLAVVGAAQDGFGLLHLLGPQRVPPGGSAIPAIAEGLLDWAETNAVLQPSRRMRFPPLSVDAYAELQALLCRLAGALLGLAPERPEGPADQRLQRLWAVLAAHAAAPFPREAAQLADTGLGWRRLEQLCRRDWGMAPRDLHQRMRLREAMSALAEGGLPVKAVASRLGFAGADRFSHWFARQTGLSPQAWRRQGGV